MGFSFKKLVSPVTKIVKAAGGGVKEVVSQTWDGVKAVGGGIQNIGGASVDVVQGIGAGAGNLAEGVGTGIGAGVETLGQENPTLLAGIATGNPALLTAGQQIETQKLQAQQEVFEQVQASRKLAAERAEDTVFESEKLKPVLIYGGAALAGLVLYAIVKD